MSFSEGADVRGTRFLFPWLKSGTDPKPGERTGKDQYDVYSLNRIHYNLKHMSKGCGIISIQ